MSVNIKTFNSYKKKWPENKTKFVVGDLVKPKWGHFNGYAIIVDIACDYLKIYWFMGNGVVIDHILDTALVKL